MTEPQDENAHLGLDRLADLEEEGLLSPAEETAAREHLAGCEQCRGDLAALAAVHEALLTDAEIPLPQDIADRLHGALAELPPLAPAAAAATTLPVRVGPSRWERSRKPVLATLAAAACIALLSVGIIHLPQSSGSKASSAAETTAAAPAATTAATQVLHSGRDYTAKTLGSDGAALLSSQASAAAAPAAAATSAAGAAAATTTAAAAATTGAAAATTGAAPAPETAGGAAAGPLTSAASSAAAAAGTTSAAATTSAAPAPVVPAATTDALAQLRDAGAAERCVALLLGSSTPPRVLDYATFNGKPAVIAVVDDPQDPNKLAVIAVGPPGCSLYSLNFISKP